MRELPKGMRVCLTMKTETLSLLRACAQDWAEHASGEELRIDISSALEEVEKQIQTATFGFPS